MRRLLRSWRAIAVALVVLLIATAALWPESQEIDIALVVRGPLQVTIDEEGQTRVRERFVVSAPVAGRLARIELEPGDPVTRGKTVLARLTPVTPALLDARARAELGAAVEAARAAVGQARAERARAAAALERSRSQLKREEELVRAGAISREEYEATETGVTTAGEALKAAEFTVNRVEFEQQMALARLRPADGADTSRTVTIVSPVDGVILRRTHESEVVVQAGEPLLEIGDARNLEIVADLLSADAVQVPAGAKVLIEQWGGAAALEGRVRRVEPSGFTKISALGVEEQRVNVTVDIVDLAAARALGDGYRVEVRVVVSDQADVLKVPTAALFRRGDDWAVFAVEGDRARLRTVTIGPRNADEAEVTDGLEVGERVVIHPPDTLRDNVRVIERPAS